MRRALPVLLLFAATALIAEDSPLVAAAKRSNRAKPKSKVITNETLSKGGGHLMTTEKQQPIVLPKEDPAKPAAPAPKVIGTEQPKPQPNAAAAVPSKRQPVEDASVLPRGTRGPEGPAYTELPKGMAVTPQQSQKPKD